MAVTTMSRDAVSRMSIRRSRQEVVIRDWPLDEKPAPTPPITRRRTKRLALPPRRFRR